MNMLKRLLLNSLKLTTHIPHRIAPGQPIPLLVVINNTRPAPIILESIAVQCIQNGKTVYTALPLPEPAEIRSHHWSNLFAITTIPESITGDLSLHILYKITSNKKTNTISHSKTIFRAVDPFPRLDHFYYGDMQFYAYSLYPVITNTAIVNFTAVIAKAMGLHFAAAVEPGASGKYEMPERGSGTWNLFLTAVEHVNRTNDIVVLTGEKINCSAGSNKNIQLLIINNTRSFTDNIPLGIHPFATGQKHIIKYTKFIDVIQQASPTSLLIIPLSELCKNSSIEQILSHNRLPLKDTTQANPICLLINRITEKDFQHWQNRWVELLAKGYRIYIYAGGDIPPDVESERHPLLSLILRGSSSHKYSSPLQTSLYCASPVAKETIIASLKSGASVITDGPLLALTVQNENGEHCILGGESTGKIFIVSYNAVSTPEFGFIKELRLYTGDTSEKKEELIFTARYADNTYTIQGDITLLPSSEQSYIRGEVISKNSNIHHPKTCITNPIWLRLPKKNQSIEIRLDL